MRDDRIPSPLLGLVERGVRALYQRVGRAPVGGRHHGADADRDMGIHPGIGVWNPQAGDCVPAALRQSFERIRIDVVPDDQELLSPVARDEIEGTLRAMLESAGDVTKAGIAGHVSQGIVVSLELVDVDHRDGDRVLSARPPTGR